MSEPNAVQVVIVDTPGLGDRGYIVHDGLHAMVIDPQRDTDRIDELIDLPSAHPLLFIRRGEVDVLRDVREASEHGDDGRADEHEPGHLQGEVRGDFARRCFPRYPLALRIGSRSQELRQVWARLGPHPRQSLLAPSGCSGRELLSFVDLLGLDKDNDVKTLVCLTSAYISNL